MMQNEYGHLITQYCEDGIFKVGYETGCDFENTLLKKLVPYLQRYERPDMISIKDDELLIMEHFAFDGSKELKRKGMKGLNEESHIASELANFHHSGELYGSINQPIEYIQSPENYIENFQKHFNNHYRKISQYIENVTANEQRTFKQISVGFFIENEYPPYFLLKEKHQIPIVQLCYTKQFLDVFEHAKDLDFVLFGFCDGTYRLHYIDKDSIAAHRKEEIDLLKIQFLKLQENQFGWKIPICIDSCPYL